MIAVELFDALPVRRVRRRGGELVEIHVDLDAADRLVEVELPATEDLVELARRYGAAAEEGSEAELAPGLAAQLDALEGTLDSGVLIIVDYGYRAEKLYHPERSRGTLLAYHRQATNEEFLERVGEQDLTAHVNFSALEDRARELGLSVLGRTTQDRFLIGNGILEAFDPPEDGKRPSASGVKNRLQAMQLIHPSGMGRAFKVLMLAKGCETPPGLSGLRDPFARDAP